MSEQNVEWVRGVYGAFSRGDIPAVLAAFSDDVEWFEAEGMPTGKALDLPAVHVWDIRDGKLARFRQFIDTVKFAEVVPQPESQAVHHLDQYRVEIIEQ